MGLAQPAPSGQSRRAGTTSPLPAVPRETSLSLQAFLRDYVARKRPVILAGLIEDWPARRRWSVEYFRDKYGDRELPVAHASGATGFFDPENGVRYRSLRLSEYLDGLERDDASSRYMLFPTHLHLPELLRDIERPVYCRNAEWFRTRFWFAAADTGGVLHRDLPENLYAQISGRKRFLLIEHSCRGSVYPYAPWSGVPNYARVDAEKPDLSRFPRFSRARRLVADLSPGDLLYIPSLVWHQARSIDCSISLNLWWANGRLAKVVRAAELFQRVRGLVL